MSPELVVLLMRLAFVAVLYGFILFVVRIIVRDLRSARAEAPAISMRGTARLEVLDSEFEGILQKQAFELRPLTTIGRALTNDIVLQDSYVSGEHALVASRDDTWLVQDLNSTNGTFVNRKPVRGETPLTHGDVIQIGRTRLKFMRA